MNVFLTKCTGDKPDKTESVKRELLKARDYKVQLRELYLWSTEPNLSSFW